MWPCTITAGNYTYDPISNLIKDNAEHITSISWTVYGKISHIVKDDGTDTTFTYGPDGHLTQSELHVYGSSRVGLLRRSLNVAGTYNPAETICHYWVAA